MRIIVCLKHAIDESELRVDAAGHPVLQGAQARMSAFDRNAVEEGVRIKEKTGGTITALSLGSDDVRKSIKEALAMGCDKAILINSSKYLDALGNVVLPGKGCPEGRPLRPRDLFGGSL